MAGFSLIELLVVLSGIAALSLLGIGGASQIMMMSKRAECASNLRQIGAALQIYASDNDGTFPMTSHTSGAAVEEAWVYQLSEYLEDGFDSIRVSPGDPRRSERLHAGGTSYVLNSFLFVAEFDPFGNLVAEPLNRTVLIPHPARTLMAFTIAEDAPTGVQNDHTHSNRWINWGSVLSDISPDLHRAGTAKADHTKGSSNYLFADGHVETWQAKELKAKIDAGENPARPPE
ncbi:MAG: type II secretion system protein [Verrucomicrobiales bacterium]